MIYQQSVKDFGAKGNGGDDYLAIQKAINAAQERALSDPNNRGAEIIFPSSDDFYCYSEPLIITGDNITLKGSPGVSLRPLYIGPALVVHPPIASGNTTAVPTTSALVGSGNAMILGGIYGNNYLNLSDSYNSNINGFSTITIEFFVRFNSLSSDGGIIGSFAKYISSVAADTAFSLVLLSGGTNLSVSMNINGSNNHFLSSTSYLINTTYHIALVYNGTTISLYKNGVLDGSASATGLIRQKITEIFSIGPLLTQFPETGITYSPINGTIDCIRVSNNVRYSGNFTPTTSKFTSDANTLFLLNFDTQFDAFTVANTNLGDHYLFYRSFPYNGINANVFTLKDISFYLGEYGSGPLLYRAPNSEIVDVKLLGGWQGIYLLENCYVCRVSFITSFNQKKFSMAFNAASAGNLSMCVLTGGMYQLVISNSGISASHMWIQSGSTTKVPISFMGDGSNAIFNLTDSTLISEDAGQVQEYGLVVSSAIKKVNVSGVEFQCPTNSLAAWIDTSTSVSFMGSTFDVSGTASSVIFKSGSNGVINETNSCFQDVAIPFSN